MSVYTSTASILNLAIAADTGMAIMIIGIRTNMTTQVTTTRQNLTIHPTATTGITRTTGILTITSPIIGVHGQKDGSIKFQAELSSLSVGAQRQKNLYPPINWRQTYTNSQRKTICIYSI
jgi:hypothetical protein